MKFRAIILLTLVGCTSGPRYKVKHIDMNRCVLECVESAIYPLEEASGSVVADLTTVCREALKTQECCTSEHVLNYAVPCKEAE